MNGMHWQDASQEVREKLFQQRFGALKAEAAAAKKQEDAQAREGFRSMLKDHGVDVNSR
jgi:hypothetical protein